MQQRLPNTSMPGLPKRWYDCCAGWALGCRDEMSYLGELRENDGRLVLKAFISPSKDVRAFILLVKLLLKLIPSNVVPSTWQFHEGKKEGSDVSHPSW